jgi:hypothetical protein
MNRRTLNIIAAICFVIAAIAFYATGPIWLGVLFTVLIVLTVYQLATGR